MFVFFHKFNELIQYSWFIWNFLPLCKFYVMKMAFQSILKSFLILSFYQLLMINLFLNVCNYYKSINYDFTDLVNYSTHWVIKINYFQIRNNLLIARFKIRLCVFSRPRVDKYASAKVADGSGYPQSVAIAKCATTSDAYLHCATTWSPRRRRVEYMNVQSRFRLSFFLPQVHLAPVSGTQTDELCAFRDRSSFRFFSMRISLAWGIDDSRISEE